MEEALIWFGRIITLLPALQRLWEAVKTKDPQKELDAQLGLIREVRDAQAREEIRGS